MTDEHRTRIRSEVHRLMVAEHVPSISIAVVQGEHITFAEAFGTASIQPPAAATPATRYQLASTSKTFAAQAILQLEAKGKLSLDDTVSRWYPAVTDANHITLRMLLSHTGGLGNFYPTHYPAGPRGGRVSPDSIIAQWGSRPSLSQPGAEFHYSNLGYEIAARIVEKVSGERYFDYLQHRVFQPAGMVETLDLDTLPDRSPLLATGYVREALGPLQPAEYEGPGWSFGAGQVVTTARDLAMWDVALLGGHVLPAVQASEEVKPVRLASGKLSPTALGLFVDTDNGHRRYYHSGQGLGFLALNMVYPDDHLAYVILVNTSEGAPTLQIADALNYVLLKPSAKEAFARALFASLQHGSLDPTLLTPDMAKEWTPQRSATFRDTLGPLGAVTAFVPHTPSLLDGEETRDYDIVAGGRGLMLHLLSESDGRLEDVAVEAALQH